MTELGAGSPAVLREGEKTELRQIVVLGMHRSGTSATTALINSLGAFVGSDEELTGASSENPRGFFERRDLRRVCDALLHSAGADWWKIADFDIARVPQEVVVEKGAEIERILANLDKHGTWVMKEPRLCLLLPFFRRYLQRPVAVFVVRNPLEVAKSLRHRNGFPRKVGLALWEAYCVMALRWSADLPRMVVHYRDLIEGPAHAAERVFLQLERLGVVGLKLPSNRVIEPILHRQSSDDDEFVALATDEQRTLWAAICDGGAYNGYLPAVSRSAQAVLEDFQEDQAARAAQLGQVASRARQLEARLAQAETRVKSGQQRITDLEAQVSTLTMKLQEIALGR
jgi:Sulfotransferase family